MSLYLDDGDVRLYQGDALEQLRQLPDGCVDMVATSPPFYGLRDYGTGEWEGGDEGCDHGLQVRPKERPPETDGGCATWYSRASSNPTWQTCGKCGARRVDRQIGLEETPHQWIASLVAVFRECRRVLADHGTLWVEIGDSYASGQSSGFRAGSGRADGIVDDERNIRNRNGTPAPDGTKPKDLIGQPWLLAFALRADGWYLRSEIIWARPNPMPESVTDRPTKAHSTVFLLSKQPRYFYDADAIREPNSDNPGGMAFYAKKGLPMPVGPRKAQQAKADPRINSHQPGGNQPVQQYGANARSVWTIPTEPTPFAHFATWPRKLVARMIQAGTSERGRCPECGKPWVRDVEVERGGPTTKAQREAASDGPMRTTYYRIGKEHTPTGKTPGSDTAGFPSRTGTTRGWSPSCACGVNERGFHEKGSEPTLVGDASDGRGPRSLTPVPCTVLDPFAGSGTTLLVARNHGRHAIGIELNPDYCQIAAQRLAQLSLLT